MDDEVFIMECNSQSLLRFYGSSVICRLSGQFKAQEEQKFIHLLCTHPKISMMSLAVQPQLSHKVMKITLMKITLLSPLLVEGVHPKPAPSPPPIPP
ncbi:hypothetical protein NQZ68_015672 [Dissostichus eleginoides]|nr:hypothetical protein NQZ68_015672 [Dissostichus eleginoides]